MSETVVEIPRRAFLPCYLHLNDSDADINFLWGGRDSGKSHYIAQRLIKKCLEAPYFRCILVKQTYESIKDAQWQTLKDVVEAWGLDELFTFKVSPLEIECVNGNKFIARGCDKPGKLKSIKDPSDAWYEEGNQISFEDFTVISTTLRTNQVKTQQWFSFNPECEGNYEDFWLYKNYFAGRMDYTFTDTTYWKNPVTGEDIPITYTSTHTTYKDNKFCSAQRIALLEQLQVTSPYYYQVFTLGKWGNKQNDSPFAYAFSREKHVGKVVPAGRSGILSFDFNRNPITCGIYQDIDGKGPKCVESVKLPNSDIYKLCDYINLHYPRWSWRVTGDATGKNSSALVQDNINYYTVIKKKLNLAWGQIKVPAVNPKIEENQVLVNAVLSLLDVKFDEEKAKALIFDCENVRMLPDGSIDKSNRQNITQQADSLDHFRYVCNTFYRHVLKL
jgi:hypothetical protein